MPRRSLVVGQGDDWRVSASAAGFQSIRSIIQEQSSGLFNFFEGTIPTEMLQLTDLRVFSFFKNDIVGELPTDFCGATYNFEVLRADCVEEVTCDCCTECCIDDGLCTTDSKK